MGDGVGPEAPVFRGREVAAPAARRGGGRPLPPPGQVLVDGVGASASVVRGCRGTARAA